MFLHRGRQPRRAGPPSCGVHKSRRSSPPSTSATAGSRAFALVVAVSDDRTILELVTSGVRLAGHVLSDLAGDLVMLPVDDMGASSVRLRWWSFRVGVDTIGLRTLRSPGSVVIVDIRWDRDRPPPAWPTERRLPCC